MGPHGFAEGFMNSITDAYHWHLKVDGFRWVQSHDTVHARSGRRVIFFTLAEQAGGAPFSFIYVHREKGDEFDTDIEGRFLGAHAELQAGVVLAVESLS